MTLANSRLAFAAVFVCVPVFAVADVHVCIEKGKRVISSMPCSGTGKTLETFNSPPPSPIPPQLTRPIGQFQASGNERFRRAPNLHMSQQRVQHGNYAGQQNLNEGLVVGGPLNGAILPGRNGGMIHGGPLTGTILPGREGGMVHGGSLSGTFWPGERGGMIHGGPMSGSIIPGAEGGMIHGGPMSGTILPPR